MRSFPVLLPYCFFLSFRRKLVQYSFSVVFAIRVDQAGLYHDQPA